MQAASSVHFCSRHHEYTTANVAGPTRSVLRNHIRRLRARSGRLPAFRLCPVLRPCRTDGPTSVSSPGGPHRSDTRQQRPALYHGRYHGMVRYGLQPGSGPGPGHAHAGGTARAAGSGTGSTPPAVPATGARIPPRGDSSDGDGNFEGICRYVYVRTWTGGCARGQRLPGMQLQDQAWSLARSL